MSDAKSGIKYFRIDGGSTVVQFDGKEWIRWDISDGLVPTSLWSADDPRLQEISLEEAIALMK